MDLYLAFLSPFNSTWTKYRLILLIQSFDHIDLA